MQIVHERGASPDRVAEIAVNDGRRVRAHDAHALLAGTGQRLLRLKRQREQAERRGHSQAYSEARRSNVR